MEQIDRLEQTIRDLRKRFGDHTVTTLSEYQDGAGAAERLSGARRSARLRRDSARAGDRLLWTSQFGAGDAGAAHHAQLQRDLDVSAYLDLSGTFDGESAARSGIALERLLVIRPEEPRLMPDLIGTLLGLQVELIVLDASAALKFVLLPDWLAREIGRGRSALLTLHPFGQTPKLDHAAVRLLVERIEAPADSAEVTNWQVRVTVLASRFTPPGGQVVIDLLVEET